MIDITNKLQEDEVPLCPLCDQPIMAYSQVALAIRKTDVDYGVICAVHVECATAEEEDEDEG